MAVRQSNIELVHNVCEGGVVLDKEREKEGDIFTFLCPFEYPTLSPSITCVKGAFFLQTLMKEPHSSGEVLRKMVLSLITLLKKVSCIPEALLIKIKTTLNKRRHAIYKKKRCSSSLSLS